VGCGDLRWDVVCSVWDVMAQGGMWWFKVGCGGLWWDVVV
jgi:hypothetical protein